jgi:alanine racemase
MMNHIVVDVTGVTSDESSLVATLLGNDGSESVSAEMLAGWAQTIHYEIVTRIGSHLRRIVIE